MNKDILNKVQSEQDYPVRIYFDVVCHSHTSMNDGSTLKQRIEDYIKMCTDAMDDSMRHWGDHYHDIEATKVTLYDEDDNEIDITNEYFNEDHWGEHSHDIKATKVTLYDEDDNEIDIADEYFNEDI